MSFIRNSVVVFVVTIGVLISHPLNAATVTLSATDVAGDSSFATGLHWSDATPPSAANDYVVDTARSLRNVADSTGTVTFAGNSLTLGSGATAGVLIFKNLSGAVVNV